MQYSELKTNIAAWLERDDLTSQLDIFVRTALRKLERTYNFRHMQTYQTGVLTANSAVLATIPARYKDNIAFRLSVNGEWRKVTKDTLQYVLALYPLWSSQLDVPKVFALDTANDQLIFRMTPDSGYTYEWYYNRYSAELSADTDTNWWTDNADEVLMAAALEQAFLFLRNYEAVASWKGRKDEWLNDIEMADVQEIFSGGAPAIKQDYSNEDT